MIENIPYIAQHLYEDLEKLFSSSRTEIFSFKGDFTALAPQMVSDDQQLFESNGWLGPLQPTTFIDNFSNVFKQQFSSTSLIGQDLRTNKVTSQIIHGHLKCLLPHLYLFQGPPTHWNRRSRRWERPCCSYRN